MANNSDHQQAFKKECFAIADWWIKYAVDNENGGFYGEVAFNNVANASADKSIILNSRILWFFSEAAQFAAGDVQRVQAYSAAAKRSYEYICQYFIDPENGGVFWMLNPQGQVVDGRKHTYAQGFAIYALSAYYDLTQNRQALELAMQCFELIERYAKDKNFGGHFEARSQTWGDLEDIRLSEKEDNSPKTMNTNLHVLEAYTGLHNSVRCLPEFSAEVSRALSESLNIFCEKIVNLDTGHTQMFMNEAWIDHSHGFSFGHDIESSWLIYKAITSLKGSEYTADQYMRHVKRLAEVAFADGLQEDGSMGDEYDFAAAKFCESSWWIQAEAMVGLGTMWNLGEGEHYKQAALNVWSHVQENFIDYEFGEWLWYSKKYQMPESSDYKVGPWKAPYHTGRAMMQMYQLFEE